jgi:hypothetical protein
LYHQRLLADIADCLPIRGKFELGIISVAIGLYNMRAPDLDRRGTGDGQAQPNHWRRISLQHRCFILGLNNAPMLGTILPLDCQKGTGGSNPPLSTIQSLDFRTSQRIDRNPRVCARFAIERGPGEPLFLRDSSKLGNSSLGAILLGPRIVAFDSPGEAADRGDREVPSFS